MKRTFITIAAAIALAAGLTGGLATSAQASTAYPVYALQAQNRLPFNVRPRTLYITLHGPTTRLLGIHWSTWSHINPVTYKMSPATATGTGTLVLTDGSEGPMYLNMGHVKIVLSSVRRGHSSFYMKVHITGGKWRQYLHYWHWDWSIDSYTG